jgi:hypothetical protein
MVAMVQIAVPFAVPFADGNLIVCDVVGAAPRAEPDVRAFRFGPPETPLGGARSSSAAQAGAASQAGLAFSGGAA